MNNPFDDETASFHVLVNEEGQYSLWPLHVAMPGGWSVALENEPRQACLDYIEKTWTDMRPESVRRAMDGAVASAADN
ncbi:MbtH family protein [Actinoplanes awajinensis]|uniref:MbtH-like domain-containing protein n=1 Tax=Actinoplanes awajinensis subsp. mycoplanecinus TaxID=135947 RepID=A0A0X3V3P9_9ACTN|nr:MbtH family NRPS accessory protein [Actinoplanes awajinensis]KUL39423.1 hypothetical protein ADL15_09725 [Actinoplanes awajinensis subsp. mycoplanecinus]WKD80530.1 MbtH-like [Actinoplanes awajinensis subsp. mycoplanecinus]